MRVTVPVPTPLRRTLTRHRRLVAGLLAGVATLLALSTLRSGPEPAPASALSPTGVTAAPGEVTVPVVLDNPSLTGTVAPGDVIDLVAIGQDGQAQVIADRARVVERTGAGTLMTSSPVILVAVPSDTALSLSAAVATDRISLLIHPPS